LPLKPFKQNDRRATPRIDFDAGIDILGRIVEVVSGRPFEGFLHERVFQPLGMMDTTFYPTEKQLTRLATMYRKDKMTGKLVAAPSGTIGPPKDARYPISAGGLYSTGPDLARLYQMMLNGGALNNQRILSAESVKAMTISYTGDLPAGFSPGMGWGLGWGVVRKPEGMTEMLAPGAYGHGGGTGPQGWIDPRQEPVSHHAHPAPGYVARGRIQDSSRIPGNGGRSNEEVNPRV